MTNNTMEEYFAALQRLKSRKERINNDTVAIEAGRKKGSIKKSRPQFAELIKAIDLAALEVDNVLNEPINRLSKVKDEKAVLQKRLDESLEREIVLIKQVFDLQKELEQLKNGSVLAFKKRR